MIAVSTLLQPAVYLESLVRRALGDFALPSDIPLSFERPADWHHGDWATNFALQVFGQKDRYGEQLRAYTNPRAFAQALSDTLNELAQESAVLQSTEVAGPGFINFRLSQQYYQEFLQLAQEQPEELLLKPFEGTDAIVEYSSPNIAKPFTVGHLRSTIIGDAVANVLEAVGYTVFRDNHLGDWGTQFGKLIYAIKTWGDEEEITNSARPVKKLVELYVKFHEEAEKDPALEDEGRAWFTRLEQGDGEARRLWQLCIDWSWVEFNAIYDQLGVHFTENGGRGYGESYFEDKMGAVIEELRSSGYMKSSEGAELFFFPDDEFPPLMILKKDGSTLYATRDLATDKFRVGKYGSNILMVNEVGAEQSLYFEQIFRIEELLGWVKPGQRVHVGHGLYRFKDQKMSTRKGNVIWLEDVLAEATQRAAALAPAGSDREIVRKIGLGALKWNDLKRKSHLDVVFDWDELLAMQGNSGPYIQYTFVRTQSVLAKVEGVLPKVEGWSALSEEENQLLRLLTQYSEVVLRSAVQYEPHHIATYLYELAQAFNSFYAHHQIIGGGESTAFRLAVTQAIGGVLAHGLSLLGIATVEKM